MLLNVYFCSCLQRLLKGPLKGPFFFATSRAHLLWLKLERKIPQLLEAAGGLNSAQIVTEYRKMFGEELDYKRAGAAKLSLLMDAIPDVESVTEQGSLFYAKKGHSPSALQQTGSGPTVLASGHESGGHGARGCAAGCASNSASRRCT